ncbi:hypothetical protein ACFYWN_12070 [Streptomyces sp. NPDC002917]|uniref:hypothetical protein n=1 Tax=Streptomyces sp. NPDC002917 TaxID=3364671 RepID=UPI0036D056C5
MTTPVDRLAASLDDAQTIAREFIATGTAAVEEAERRRAEEEQRAERYAGWLAAAGYACNAPDWPSLADTVQALAERARAAEQRAEARREDHQRACVTIADMHAAAVGEVRGPIRGVVEDVAQVRARADRLAKAWRDAEADATATEKRLDAHRRALAAVLAKPGETPFEELTEYAAHTLTRNGARLLGAEQRATTAEHIAKSNMQHVRHVVAELKNTEATLQRVRDAETLADALAAVAEHDGLTPAAARTTANIAAAAEQPAAVEAERDRAHAIALAEANRRAARAEAALDAIRRARDWGTVWAELGMVYGLTSTQAGQEARTRRTTAERAARQLADGWRRHALEADARADRHLAAWRNARDRAATATRSRDRLRASRDRWVRAAETRLDRMCAAERALARQEQK